MNEADGVIHLLEQVVQEEGPKLARHAYFTLKSLEPDLSVQETEDVISEAFVAACHAIRTRSHKLPTVRKEMLPWLRRIILLKCLEFRRRHVREFRRRQMKAEEESLLVDHFTIDLIDSEDYESALAKACENLSDDERQILNLFFKERLTSQTIARRLNRDAATVRKTKQRALEKVRRYLEKTSV